MSDTDSSESFIDCELVGDSIYHDHDLNFNFYCEVIVNDHHIMIGDVVKVHLNVLDLSNSHNPMAGQFGDEYGFGVVLALYEDVDEVVCAEIRWLWTKRDLNSRLMRLYNAELPMENEVLVSEQLDDIPVGSIVEHVSVQGYVNPSQRQQDQAAEDDDPSSMQYHQNPTISSSLSSFMCRFQVVEGSNSLQPCDFITAYQQGIELSHYRHAYDIRMYHNTSYDDLNKDIEPLDPYSEAIKRLHISVIPDRLPCRAQDQATITNFIIRGLKRSGEHSYGPLLISGMPGSGKTATVIASIREIQRSMMNKGDIPSFEYVEVNCLRIKKPDDAYSIIWRVISGQVVSGSKALKNLNQYFMPDQFKASSSLSSLSSSKTPIVCLLDEMEFLINKNQTAMYNFLEWSRATHVQFILIGVANAMDVVERVMQGCNASRSVIKTTQISFSSYTFHNITAILADRISSLEIPGVDHRTIETCARKAATFTGDIRTALKIFQRALELLREEHHNNTLSSSSSGSSSSDFSKLIALVKRASDAYVNKPHIYMLQQSCHLDQAIMIAICKHIKATGGNVTLSINMIYDRLDDLLSWSHNITPQHVSYHEIQSSCMYITHPRIEIFYEAILRLLEEGFLGDALSSNRGKTWYISDNMLAYDGASCMMRHDHKISADMMVGVRLEFGDIIGALRDVNVMVAYVDA